MQNKDAVQPKKAANDTYNKGVTPHWATLWLKAVIIKYEPSSAKLGIQIF